MANMLKTEFCIQDVCFRSRTKLYRTCKYFNWQIYINMYCYGYVDGTWKFKTIRPKNNNHITQATPL